MTRGRRKDFLDLLVGQPVRTGSGLMKPVFGAAALRPTETPSQEHDTTIPHEPPPLRSRAMTGLDSQPSIPIWRGSGTVLKLSAATVLCLACLGMLSAAWLMLPVGEKLTFNNAPNNAPTKFATVSERKASPSDVALPETGVVTSAAPARAGPAPAALPPSDTPEPISTISRSAPITPASPLHLSAAEVGALLARGDALFALGDAASARLYYERAADAGERQAALKLGKSFDPVFLSFARLHGVRGDTNQAASWYRRARDLGDSEAEILLKRLEPGITD
jgi:hypothetical protein